VAIKRGGEGLMANLSSRVLLLHLFIGGYSTALMGYKELIIVIELKRSVLIGVKLDYFFLF